MPTSPLQASISVMSIGAITCPCTNSTNDTKPHQPTIDHKNDFYQLPSFSELKACYDKEPFASSPSFSTSSCSTDHENESAMFNQSSMFQPLEYNRTSRSQSAHFDLYKSSNNQLHTRSTSLYNIYSTAKTNDHKKDDVVLANRRARNKLASAKYRAKKQALTHAMEDRIMQLATQVMGLQNELSKAKKSEIEFKNRYDRLVQYYQSNNIMVHGENL